jgi:hypothetical protein
MFKNYDDDDDFKQLILYILSDPVKFSKFGLEILELAIDNKQDSVIKLICDKICEMVKNNDYHYYNNMNIMSLNLIKLYNKYYTELVMKYILNASIVLDSCPYIKNSTNTSLYAYSSINIKKQNYFVESFIHYFNYFNAKIRGTQVTSRSPTISFIVSLPKMCRYQEKNYNLWNELLYTSKSVLFYNIDSNNYYKWWNFAAIVDFKWNTFGKYYYYLIWLFFIIFYSCFSLAILENNNTLLIISIILGFIHLYFEFQQFLWNPKLYFKDLGNIFGK